MKNKHNIEIALLKKYKVNKKDYNSVYKIDYITINNQIVPNLKYVSKNKKQYNKHTIHSHFMKKQFFSSPPVDSKISSIYNQIFSNFKTKDVENHIRNFKKSEKI